MTDTLNIYQIVYRRIYDTKDLNEPNNPGRFGLEIDIVFHAEKSTQKAEKWFREKGVREVNLFIPGARGADIIKIEQVRIPRHVIFAIPYEVPLEDRVAPT